MTSFQEGLKLITNQGFMQIIKCNSLMKNIEQVSCSNDQKKTKMFLKHFDEFIIGTIDFVSKPISFSKVVANKKWKLAMLEKVDSISYNWTWQLYELPPRKKLITTRWFYKILNGSSGNSRLG